MLTVRWATSPECPGETMAGNIRLDPLREHQGPGGGGFRQDDPELLPSVTRHDVVGADRSSNQFGDLLEGGGPRQVTVAVVEFLEIVDIHHEEGHAVSVPPGAFQFPAEELVEPPVVEDSR